MSEQKKKGMMKSCRDNPWIVSSIVLAIILIAVLSNGLISNVSAETAGTTIVDWANEQAGGGVELLQVNEAFDLYEVVVSYQGEQLPLYLTKDGKNLIQGVTPLTASATSTQTTTTTTTIPQSDKPTVELFIWSYCPYGVQAQGPLAEVASLLGANVDIKPVLYYDGHGAYETQQNKIQACIREIDLDNYWKYASSFVDNIYPKCGVTKDIDCDKTESIKLMASVGIDATEILSCVDSRGQQLIDSDSARAQSLGVTGSPTLVINGVKASVDRTAEAYLEAICDSFNNAPAGCSGSVSSAPVATGAAASC